MNVLLKALAGVCSVQIDPRDRTEGAYKLVFENGVAITTIRIVFNDRQSGADLIITNMTTLPLSEKQKGYGSAAVGQLVACAGRAGQRTIHAVQVQKINESFWERNGFVRLGNATNDFALPPTENAP